jgi:putative radical SAM enzyme (TIGR03279 family)
LKGIVKSVTPGSIAEEIGLEPGDMIVKINGEEIKDILDYRFYCSSDEYELEIEKQNGEREIIEIENYDYEELGAEFENGLLDKPKVCRNKCLFCFVDQLPKKLRKTLYFKDDDYRLSALMGNYITLTNLSEEDIDRIIAMRLPRINVSVHTVDPDLRAFMLNNKNSDVLSIMKRFRDAGIKMDCQVVLCRDINDGQYLNDTITELAKMYPYVQSLSVVPVGLTEHRQGLYDLKRFDKESAEAVINQIEQHRQRLLKEIGTRFVFASDEFYVVANRTIPEYDTYEDFLQIENGVGLIASLTEEFECAKRERKVPANISKKTSVTGVSAYKYIDALVKSVTDNVEVVPIINTFFGKTITVTGLITGGDIINTLRGKDLGKELLIPSVMLNYDGVFLDDMTVSDVEKELNIKVRLVKNDGYDMFDAITKEG